VTSSRHVWPQPAVPPARWRIGVFKGAPRKTQPEVARNFKASLVVLREFADVTETELPKYPYDAMIGAIIAAEGGAAFRDVIQDGRVQTLQDPDGRRGGYSYLVTYAVDYVDAMRMRVPLTAAFQKLFDKFDAIVAPSFATVAFPIGVPFDKAYPGTEDGPVIPACNLAGIPAINVPNGVGRHGLPTGLSFIGRAFSEPELLALAGEFQARTHWHTKRPPLAT
jgi:aspartyl-tRNA(Asn)/glutamyl-tRNA(Gln) amidotransferase subunit A